MPLSKIESASLETAITAVDLAYTGTLTGGTGVVNLGSGQVYKDASGKLGIGTTAPDARVDAQVSSGAGYRAYKTTTGGFNAFNFYTANENVIGTVGITSTNDTFYLGYNTTPVLTWTGGGNVGIGTSSPTAKLHVNGTFKYQPALSAGGGINIRATYTYNDNSANTIGNVNFGFCIVTITQGNGLTTVPVFMNSGSGVAWSGSMFDPDNGNFAYGSGPTVSFATVGTSANSYTLSMSGGGGIGTITRTAGSAAYTVNVLVFVEN